MPKLEAVLFDLDGTLRDSMQAILPAIEYALKTHGIEDVDQIELNKHTHSIRSVHQHLASSVSYDYFLAAYDKKLIELWGKMGLYEHVDAVLRVLQTKGYKMAIVSSARRAQGALDEFDIAQYFDAVVGGYDTKEHKPSPEPVLLALDKLQISPNKAVMIGDLAADIIAAKEAKVLAVGITHGFGSRLVLEEAGADYIIDSLMALPEVLDTIEQNGS
jgi:HAD superfamily hydrolase (TIGR01549 family)